MKRNIKRIAGCLAVLCLLFWALNGLNRITMRKESQQKYQDFFAQEADFDVLFLGNSKVMNAVLPPELWNDYGIVSYNLAGHGCFLPTSYWILRNALEYTTPKVVVIDCSSISSQRSMPSIQFTHQSFDAFPLSMTKLRGVMDMVGESEEGAGDALERQIELLWPFFTYHSRWNELDKPDFALEAAVEKGAESRIAVHPPADFSNVNREAVFEEDSLGKEYLIRMIGECKARGIEVLLTFVPFPASEGYWKEANCVYEIADAQNVEYINFLELDVVDYRTDCYDADSHLNPSGARKVTEYLGSFLRDHYAVPDRREDSGYSHWNWDYERYYDHKLEWMWECETGYEFLMLLADDDFSFVMELSNSALKQDEQFLHLLRNLGADPEQLTDGITYLVADRARGTMEYIPQTELEAGDVETGLGTLHLAREQGASVLYLNGSECIRATNQYRYDLRVSIFSLAGKEIKKLQLDVN